MKVLLDQGTPIPLRRYLRSHDVTTVYELAWSSLENGTLIGQAEAAGFDVLVTTDKNWKHQQNLGGRRLAVVVLLSTSWPKIQLKVSAVVVAVEEATIGSYVDGEAFAAQFTEDSDYVVVNGMHIKGRQQNAATHQQFFDTFYKGTKTRIQVKSVRFLRPDLALMHTVSKILSLVKQPIRRSQKPFRRGWYQNRVMSGWSTHSTTPIQR